MIDRQNHAALSPYFFTYSNTKTHSHLDEFRTWHTCMRVYMSAPATFTSDCHHRHQAKVGCRGIGTLCRRSHCLDWWNGFRWETVASCQESSAGSYRQACSSSSLVEVATKRAVVPLECKYDHDRGQVGRAGVLLWPTCDCRTMSGARHLKHLQ